MGLHNVRWGVKFFQNIVVQSSIKCQANCFSDFLKIKAKSQTDHLFLNSGSTKHLHWFSINHILPWSPAKMLKSMVLLRSTSILFLHMLTLLYFLSRMILLAVAWPNVKIEYIFKVNFKSQHLGCMNIITGNTRLYWLPHVCHNLTFILILNRHYCRFKWPQKSWHISLKMIT